MFNATVGINGLNLHGFASLNIICFGIVEFFTFVIVVACHFCLFCNKYLSINSKQNDYCAKNAKKSNGNNGCAVTFRNGFMEGCLIGPYFFENDIVQAVAVNG